ncbi:MAG: hypothetical protein AB9M53_00375 [Leptothrix sp. (in: b-proteobacteria)]
MYRRTHADALIRLSDGAWIPPEPTLIDWQEAQSWLAAGGVPEPMPAPTDAELIARFSAAIQSHIDAQAQALGYDGIATAVTYADEPAVAQFQAEGRALRAWRSQVWAAAYATLAAVKAGAPLPNLPALIASLPAFPALKV